jgi:ribosomal protein S18 acetylase RimI-like enzyme
MIRKIQEKDENDIRKFLNELHRFHAEGKSDIFDAVDVFSDEYWKMVLYNENVISAADIENGVLAGYIVCQIKIISGVTGMKDRKYMHIDDLFVGKEFRCQGIASQLIAYAEGEAKKAGCYSSELNVWSFNKEAYELYKRYGYTEQRTILEKKLH